MSGEACPLPRQPGRSEAQMIQRMLEAERVAVVGMSDKPDRPGYYVPEYLRRQGYDIVPVNPGIQQSMGLKVYPSLADLPAAPDVVVVFRRAEACAQVAREAIAAGARGLWLQSGITNDEARQLAEAAGLDFIQDRCMMVEHRRLSVS